MLENTNAPMYSIPHTIEDGITCVNFCKTRNPFLLVTSWDNSCRIFNVETHVQLMQHDHKAAVLDGCFIQDTHIISGGLEKQVKLFDVQTQKQILLQQHDQPIKCVKYSQTHQLVISGGWDQCIKLWDLRSNQLVQQVDQLPGKVYAMDITPDSNTLVLGLQDLNIHIYDLRSGSARLLQRRESSIRHQTRCVSCFPDNSGYAVGSVESRIAMEYFDTSEQVQQLKYAFKCHRVHDSENNTDTLYPVNAIAFHPKYGTFATGGSDGYVTIWDGKSRKRLMQLRKLPQSICSLSFNFDGTYMAIASSSLWEQGVIEEESSNKSGEIWIRHIKDVDVKPK